MAIDGVNVNIGGAGVADIIQQAQSRAVDNDANKEDPADAARKKLQQKVEIKKASLKGNVQTRETFSRDQANNQKMQQLMGGSAGPEVAGSLKSWSQNGDIQQKLTEGQKNLFREAVAKNPPKGAQAAKAMDNVSKQPGFKKAVNNSQQMGTLQKALTENPKLEKPAGDIIKNRFMQSSKADPQAKSKFMDFGLKQAAKGKSDSVKKAGDMLSSLTKGGVGRSAQRAAASMAARNPADAKAMSNVDGFVQDPNVGKMPSFAKTKSTELLAKANGKEEVGEGFKKLAGEPKFKVQTAENKGRFFSTVGTGRPSEYRQISDSLLTSLQNPGFPKRQGQVKKFLNNVSKQVQKGGAKGVDTKSALKSSKSSPMPKLSLIPMNDEEMDPEEMARARSQNRANVMQFFNKLTRMYEGAEKKLKSAKFLEDVNKLQTLRLPEDLDTSSLTPEEQAFYNERMQGLKAKHGQVSKLQRQRSRELRTKRRRGGKAGRRRAGGKQPRYFSPTAGRGTKASEAFMQATGTDSGGPKGLPQTPGRANRAARESLAMGATGGDISQQVSAALSGVDTANMTAHTAGQVAQAIAQQVASQVAAQVTASLLGGSSAIAEAPQAAPAAAAQPQAQQGKVDGWGIPRSFERDLGASRQAPVRAVQPQSEGAQSFDDAVAEKYTGRMLVKDPTSIRSLGELFDSGWKELNRPEQALLKNLGWNQQMWDTKDTAAARWPGAMMSSFVNLMPAQREAVRKLGFSPHDWDKKVQAFTSGRNA